MINLREKNKVPLEKPDIEVRHARLIQKVWLSKKANLPAQFDDCMAYFTGYTSTKLIIHSAEEFLLLARNCADYCNKLQDKESLQLLMYAVVRRVYPGRFSGFDDNLLGLLDLILGDAVGIYGGLYGNYSMNQIGDATEIFKILLLYIESHRKESVNFKPFVKATVADARAKPTTRDASLWYEKFKIDRMPEDPIAITRGGGLYNFLDMKKGLVPGMQEDTRTLNAIYVTPENRAERDDYYAYDSKRCRFFLDRPSVQSASIAAKHLKTSNFNSYEALIEVQDFSEMKNVQIQVKETAYFGKDCISFRLNFLSELKKNYLNNSDPDRLKRLYFIFDLTQCAEKKRIHSALSKKRRLKPVLAEYITRLKQLFETYKQSLVDYPNSEFEEVVTQWESILNHNDTTKFIRDLKKFHGELKEKKALLFPLEKNFSALEHDVLTLILDIAGFNDSKTNSQMLFFGGRVQSFIDETSKIVEEAINSLE